MPSITRKISEGAILISIQKILTIFLGVFSTFFILRALGTYQYGLTVLAFSIIGIFNVFLDLGIGGVIVSDTAGYLGLNEKDKAKRILKSYSKLQLTSGFILSFFVIALSFIGKNYYGGEISKLLIAGSFLVFLNGIKNIFITFFSGFSKFNFLALFNFSESLLKFFLVILLIVYMEGGIVSVIITNLLSVFGAIILTSPLFFKILNSLKGVLVFPQNLFLNLIKGHGKFQILMRPLNNLSDPLRMWIIEYFSGVDSVAVFQVALKIYSYLSQLVYSIETPLFPVISQELAKDKKVAKKIYERISKYFFWVSIIVMIFGFLFIPYFLELFFGDKYLKSVPLLYLLLLTFLVGGMALVLRPMLFALRAQKEILKADFTSLIIGYPISTYLTYLYGPVGFAIPIGSFLSFFLRYNFLKKIDSDFSFNFSGFFKWDKEDFYLLRRVYSAFSLKVRKII